MPGRAWILADSSTSSRALTSEGVGRDEMNDIVIVLILSEGFALGFPLIVKRLL